MLHEAKREQHTSSWNSALLPERDQFSAWREACCQRVYAVTPEREGGARAFRGRIDTRRLGGLDVIDVRCEPHRVSRSASDVRRNPSDTYYVYLQTGEAAWFVEGGRELHVSKGDIVLADPNVEFATRACGDFAFRVFRVARRAVDPYLAQPDRMPMLRLPSASAEAALLRACLGALWDHGDALDPRVAEPASLALIRLVALCAGVAPNLPEAMASAVQRALLERIQRYIEQHFADATLSPKTAARALGVSVRALHLALEPSGRTFAERLSARRLEEARTLLTSPHAAARAIAELAFDVGFSDLSTFHRAFRARWGLTPGALRAGMTG